MGEEDGKNDGCYPTRSNSGDAMSALADWDSFYVIVGSSAGALIGLQFVVMTLIAVRPPERAAEAGPAFATPTIIHFSAVLLLSAVLRAPFQTLLPIAVILGLIGFSGLVYTAVVIRRMRVQTAYQPEFEDWMFHAWLPLLAYALLALPSMLTESHTREVLFAVGAAALVLLFTGIHNAWDSTTYHVWVNLRNKSGQD